MMQVFKILLMMLVAFLGSTAAESGSEGNMFALSFSQGRSDWKEGGCIIYINAKQDTSVTITEPEGASNTFNISANETFGKSYSYDIRVVEGIEDKGILIDAEDDISVMLSNYRDDGNMEAILVLPLHTGTQEYTIMSYQSTNDITCVTTATCSFYSVVAYDNDTDVSVYKLEDGQPIFQESFILQKNQVYTNRTTNSAINRNYDFTGYFISSDKPVSVNSGNPCADTNPNKTAGHLWGSIPSDEFAGTRHISHSLNYNGATDNTLVRIVALSDDTQVIYGTIIDTIQYRGDFKEYTLNSGFNTVFGCNKACKAAQFSMNSAANLEGGAVFMAVLVPTEAYTTNVVFNKPETPTEFMTDYMSIVYLTETPANSPLYFDGTALTGWTVATGEGFSTVEIVVSGPREEAHSLISSSGIGFSALIHGQGIDARGYGFIAGNNGGDFPVTNITRPNPQYRVSMTGKFKSADGVDFTISCTDMYSIEMNDVASSMVIEVNNLIGSTLCSSLTTNDIRALSVSSPFLTESNKGSTELRFILQPNLNRLTQSQVVTCADEIGLHLVDHDNWRNPILPILPGCPQVVFDSRMFNDSGKDWICLNTLDDLDEILPSFPENKQTTLMYSLRHNGLFKTVDASDMTPECITEYNNGFDESTFSQVQAIEGMITAGTICLDTDVIIETATTSLTGQGHEGISHQNYVLALGGDSLASDVYLCADEVSEFLSPHTNWQQPIIPSVAGCPNVVFDPLVFTEDSQQWLCIN